MNGDDDEAYDPDIEVLVGWVMDQYRHHGADHRDDELTAHAIEEASYESYQAEYDQQHLSERDHQS